MVRLDWTPQAYDDLKSIYQYISYDSPTFAKFFVEKIYYRVDQLRHFPQSGCSVPEIDDRNIRALIYKNYRIVYQIMSKEHIRILTVFHSTQNIDETKFP